MPRFDGLDRPDMLGAFAAMGCVTPSGMGGWLPLAWAEIEAFGRCTGRLTTPWEHETIRAMSEAYVSGLSDGRNLLSIMPIERD